MKYCLIPVFALFTLAASYGQSKPVDFFTLKNYFFKDPTLLPPGFNCMLISNKAQFDKTFGIEPGLKNDTLAPHFWREYVVAIAVAPSYYEVEVSIDKIDEQGHILNVYCSDSRGGKRDYLSTALSMVTIERSKKIKTIRFFKGKMQLMTLGVVK
jgi:hypothetical protein